MKLSDNDITLSRLHLLKLTLVKIQAGEALQQIDNDNLSLAGAILLSAPRMITANLEPRAAEYKQEEIRSMAYEFTKIASSLGVVAPKQITLA